MTSRNPPFVIHVVGEVAPDGSAIGLSVERTEQGPADLCFRIEDVQYLINLLLALGCEAVQRPAASRITAPPTGGTPLPVTAINVGQDDDERVYLTFEVGAASLMFGLSQAQSKEVGQTLLTLSGP